MGKTIGVGTRVEGLVYIYRNIHPNENDGYYFYTCDRISKYSSLFRRRTFLFR